MLKIHHPGPLVREREKKVTPWENVRSYKYGNGVECQILLGFLPHGQVQSAISANRAFTLEHDGTNLNLVFQDQETPLLDFISGDRLDAERANVQVLDPCTFVPNADVAISHEGETGTTEGDLTTFKDGTTVKLQAHGGHAHVEAKNGDKAVKTFFNGKENKLFVFGPVHH